MHTHAHTHTHTHMHTNAHTDTHTHMRTCTCLSHKSIVKCIETNILWAGGTAMLTHTHTHTHTVLRLQWSPWCRSDNSNRVKVLPSVSLETLGENKDLRCMWERSQRLEERKQLATTNEQRRRRRGRERGRGNHRGERRCRSSADQRQRTGKEATGDAGSSVWTVHSRQEGEREENVKRTWGEREENVRRTWGEREENVKRMWGERGRTDISSVFSLHVSVDVWTGSSPPPVVTCSDALPVHTRLFLCAERTQGGEERCGGRIHGAVAMATKLGKPRRLNCRLWGDREAAVQNRNPRHGDVVFTCQTALTRPRTGWSIPLTVSCPSGQRVCVCVCVCARL